MSQSQPQSQPQSQLQSKLSSKLSSQAFNLVRDTFSDIPQGELTVDYHTHLAGTGSNSCCYVNESCKSLIRHPINTIKCKVFMRKSGVTDSSKADIQYVERLVSLITEIKEAGLPWGKHMLLAMDHYHDENGVADPIKTGIYCPNDYVWEVCQANPSIFSPCVSIHPYRSDAISELNSWADRGVKMIKWLPNSMNISLSNRKCFPFYETMQARGLILLVHVGDEHAVDVGINGLNQRLGDPSQLIYPLNHGVKTIAAHFASEGSQPNGTPNFQILAELMRDSSYKNLLFSDISAMMTMKRCGTPLRFLLENDELHSNLINGSDYPVPVIDYIEWSIQWVALGYITTSERLILNEIYAVNPLLHDYVAKRLLKRVGFPSKGFPSEMFTDKLKLFS